MVSVCSSTLGSLTTHILVSCSKSSCWLLKKQKKSQGPESKPEDRKKKKKTDRDRNPRTEFKNKKPARELEKNSSLLFEPPLRAPVFQANQLRDLSHLFCPTVQFFTVSFGFDASNKKERSHLACRKDRCVYVNWLHLKWSNAVWLLVRAGQISFFAYLDARGTVAATVLLGRHLLSCRLISLICWWRGSLTLLFLQYGWFLYRVPSHLLRSWQQMQWPFFFLSQLSSSAHCEWRTYQFDRCYWISLLSGGG